MKDLRICLYALQWFWLYKKYHQVPRPLCECYMQLVGNAEDCLVFLQEILLFTLIKTVSEYFHKLFPVFFWVRCKSNPSWDHITLRKSCTSSLLRCKGQNIGAKLIMQRLGNDRKGSPLTSYSTDTQAALTHLKSRDIPM